MRISEEITKKYQITIPITTLSILISNYSSCLLFLSFLLGSGKTSNFHKQRTSSDNSIPHHINVPSGTAQYKNHFNPEVMNNLEDADNNKEGLNKDIWEMKSFPSSDLQSRQVCLNESA